jgi:hypothetical protein
MPRRPLSLAATAVAALFAFPAEIQAQPQSLQYARPGRFSLPPERPAWDDEKLLALRALSPAGVADADLGWLKAREAKPGVGLQLELDQGWALYADWDRYRTRLPQVRENVDTILVGLQLRFH